MKNIRLSGWESHLIRQAVAGDRDAFEMLADEYRPALMKLAVRLLRNSDDANDAVQEALIKAMRSIRDFDTTRPMKPWLSRICTNCCVDHVRHRRRDPENIDQHEYCLEETTMGVDAAEGSIIRSQILEAIARLPLQYKKIIVMRHFNHMDVVDIAKELRKPEGTIKSWLFRARAMLKKDLQPVCL